MMMRLRTATPRTTAAAIGLAAALLALPLPAARATSGGTSAPSGPTEPTGPTGPAIGAVPAAPAPSGPNTLAPPAGVIVHHVASVSGQLTPAAAGRRVLLEVLDPNGGWTVAGTATAGHGGTFSIGWRAAHIGRFTLRAVRAGHASASAVASAPTAVVEVYRSAVASWFGPGFYGNQTACGETMTPELLGVAHPSLPCGTPVDLIYNGHTITVPVVDRGPFVAGVSYDLTAATAQALGMTETSRIGALAEHQA